MPEFMFHIPLPIAGFLIIGCLCAYSLIGLLLVRRFVLPRLRIVPDDSGFSGTLVQAVMVFYGLAVALVAVSVWENHSEVSRTVSLEASRIGSLYRDVSAYPEPSRTELRNELQGYTDYVINEAWPLQRKGLHPTGGVMWMNRFQTKLCGFQPANDSQMALHAEALRAYNQLIEVRRLRLDYIRGRLPDALWFVINIGACISLGSTFLFKVSDVRLHATQVLLLSIFVGLVIMLVLAFDRPFVGDLGIDPFPYQLIREQLMKQ